MIISKQKNFDKITGSLSENNIFIIGCGKCAAKLHTGGEPEVLDMKNRLEIAGKNITGWTVLRSVCTVASWEDVLSLNPSIKNSDALLIMSCGGGVSVMASASGMQVYPALDTESIGGISCGELVDKQCVMCGDCVIDMFGGICPLTRCAKGLLNGPCGGAFEGKCEVDERICAWEQIFERLKVLGRLKNIETIFEPKDHNIKNR